MNFKKIAINLIFIGGLIFSTTTFPMFIKNFFFGSKEENSAKEEKEKAKECSRKINIKKAQRQGIDKQNFFDLYDYYMKYGSNAQHQVDQQTETLFIQLVQENTKENIDKLNTTYFNTHSCAHCHTLYLKTAIPCGICFEKFYCDEKCLEKGWDRHKNECR